MFKTASKFLVSMSLLTISVSVLALDPVYFNCGKTKVKAHFSDDDKLTLTIKNKKYELNSVISASGAKYETPKGTKPYVLFWNKGEDAMLEINGKSYPQCHEVKSRK